MSRRVPIWHKKERRYVLISVCSPWTLGAGGLEQIIFFPGLILGRVRSWEADWMGPSKKKCLFLGQLAIRVPRPQWDNLAHGRRESHKQERMLYLLLWSVTNHTNVCTQFKNTKKTNKITWKIINNYSETEMVEICSHTNTNDIYKWGIYEIRRRVSTRGECRWPRADVSVHVHNRACAVVTCLHAPRVSQLLLPSRSFPGPTCTL